MSVDDFSKGDFVVLDPPFAGQLRQEHEFNGFVGGLVVDVVEGDKPYVVITSGMPYEGRLTQELLCFPHEITRMPADLCAHEEEAMRLKERGYAPVLEKYGIDL